MLSPSSDSFFGADALDTIDRRLVQLVNAEGSEFRRGFGLLKGRGLSKAKSVDIKMVLEFGPDFIFKDLVPLDVADGFWSAISIIQILLQATSDVDPDRVDDVSNMEALSLQVVEAMSRFERQMTPLALGSIVNHTVIHYPDFIHRWNSVRNYWAFGTER